MYDSECHSQEMYNKYLGVKGHDFCNLLSKVQKKAVHRKRETNVTKYVILSTFLKVWKCFKNWE